MIIYILNISNGRTTEIEVEPSDTIETVKLLIYEADDIPPDQ